ncbi:CCP protein [Trifolium pratense]|uniref:CCP protein n=1 Tax=Trifolium pratense TaxID=57577 RepID=A0A2K3JPY6_TRIPR|nr:CCP protein [Trifolium pratense]
MMMKKGEIEKESATTDNSKKRHSLDEKLAAVLKGRAEELERLYDDGNEEFQNSRDS